MVTGESSKDKEDHTFKALEDQESFQHGGESVGSTSLEIGSESGRRDESEPILFPSSSQIRRHKDGFVIKESASSRSPQTPDSFRDEETLSAPQSPMEGEGSLYSLDVRRPLSNTDQVLMNINSDDPKSFSCMPPESLLFSPSPSNSPKTSLIPPGEPLGKTVNSISSDLKYATLIGSESIETTPITISNNFKSSNSALPDFESLKSRNEPKNVYMSEQPKRTEFSEDSDTFISVDHTKIPNRRPS